MNITELERQNERLHQENYKLKSELEYVKGPSSPPPMKASAECIQAGENRRPMSRDELLTHIFSYHNDPAMATKYTAINSAARNLADVILSNVPDCEDRRGALKLVQSARMWANAAVALDGVAF